MDAARKLATYADLLALPEDVKAEIIEGSLVTMPSPRPRHSNVQGALRRYIGGPSTTMTASGARAAGGFLPMWTWLPMPRLFLPRLKSNEET